ncbi:ribonuclease domain-containing protein [Lysobacter solisilvae (ex Woo and Kim 2020)]|uniref:Ribonuclease n=1 Tax=Agrilutibacter terrestris TaxID=2865112 RepID=A0A7H0FTP5_9GAMM|nr:ribonuclease domain-containing protein [Lysobacter terrestris]QNP39411.1 ribonuclease [Lysobacter terrestris]
MRRSSWIIVAALLALGLWLWLQPHASAPVSSAGAPASAPVATPQAVPAPPATRADAPAAGYPAFLPTEAHAVLARIARGGPYEYRQDGGVFQNRERRLPAQPRGYYREFTVETPGSRDRGARRIITGGQPPREYWYTDDHYRSFQRFEVAP